MAIKVLRMISRLNIGGPARNAVLLTEGLQPDKYKSVLICGEVSENEGNMMYLAQEKGIDPVIVPELGREVSFKNDWKSFWKIYKIICAEKPDIIHTHTSKVGLLGRFGGILYNITHFGLRKNRCKIFHTMHGHIFNGYFDKTSTWFFLWVEKIISFFTDVNITVSESLRRELVEKFRLAPAKRVVVVELGFELDGLLNLTAREVSPCINIGIVGRLVPVKNHKMLFRVIERLRTANPGLQTKFFVIGEGELKKELEEYARELSIDGIVEFRGWVKNLSEIYKDLDIVVLTSVNEGTPVSIIEAMATAKPVVATKVGGVLDIVEDKKNGYLIDSSDEQDYTDKLLELIKDSEKRKRFGKHGRESVKNRFSKERLIKDIDKLYNKALSKGDS
ncbi:glycosyltransferase [Candidatus Omnitrophota bacterium]